jgi:hypothetical protein
MDDITDTFLCKDMYSFRIKLLLFQNATLFYKEGVSNWLRTTAVQLTKVTVIYARNYTDGDGVNEVMGDHVSASPTRGDINTRNNSNCSNCTCIMCSVKVQSFVDENVTLTGRLEPPLRGTNT